MVTTKWQTAAHQEMSQLDEYDTFHTLPKGSSPPPGYKKIRVHLVYAVKHDGRHKELLVDDGHLTDVQLDSVYPGVVCLKGICLVAFLAMHNDLQLWSTDIGNTYLEAKPNFSCPLLFWFHQWFN